MFKITTDNGVLAVSNDTKMALTITNPLFNDRGSGSLPFSIPDCEHNQKTLGFPNRLTRKMQQNLSFDCTIETDMLTFAGTLKYVGSDSKSIELTFYLNEGAFWNWAKNTRLRDISVPENKAFIWDQDLDSYTNNIWPDVEMAFFPIAIEKASQLTINNLPDDPDYYANNQLRQNSYTIINNPHNLTFTPRVRGANISGFLYVFEVLRWIFNDYGLRYNINELENIDELKRCVVLNSASEPFRGNWIRYRELLPSGTVMDFINAVENSFCCRFYPDLSKKLVDVKLFKNISISNSNLLISKLTIQSCNILQLTLSNNKVNSDNTTISNSLTDDYIEADDDFEEESTPPRIHEFIYVTSDTKDTGTYPEKVVFNIPTQCYFTLLWEENNEGKWEYKANVFHSKYYNYQDKTTQEKKEIKPDSSFCPMVNVQIRQFFESEFFGAVNFFDYYTLMPHYAVQATANYINDLLDHVYDWDIEMPISFAFYRGKFKLPLPDSYQTYLVGNPEGTMATINEQVVFNEVSEYNFPWGSVDVYTPDGEKLNGSLTLQPNLVNSNIALRWVDDYGLLQNFFAELEQLYLKSGIIVNINNIKLSDLLNHKIYDFLINEEYLQFLINDIKITLTPQGIKFDSATGITVKPYL